MARKKFKVGDTVRYTGDKFEFLHDVLGVVYGYSQWTDLLMVRFDGLKHIYKHLSDAQHILYYVEDNDVQVIKEEEANSLGLLRA